ncbi:MAG: ROK family transcriptional regulator [Sphaerochaetaceae bacterium]|jgi:hypothetical protein|nr:ROK family transcriptional regulator [Sphaerochaetaceae bacterium]
MKINNNNFQKNQNTSLVAKLVWRNPHISRVDIARELNLYRSTVTNIVSSLIDNRIVYEEEADDDKAKGVKAGRKPIILKLNEKFGCVAGIDIQPSHYRLCIAALDSGILRERSGAIPEDGFEKVLDFLMAQVNSLAASLEIPLLGVCLGVPGIVDAANGIIVYAEPFKIRNFNVYEHFKNRYGVRALVENDANCCAWYALTTDNHSAEKSFMCVFADPHDGNYQFRDRCGVGIGIGIAIDGDVYHGSNNAAGEFCSYSWRKGIDGQMNLPIEILKASGSSIEAWKIILGELLSNLMPVVTILDPETVYLMGSPFASQTGTMELIKTVMPQFLDILEKTGCALAIHGDDSMVVAKGAAMMFLQKIFNVPELSETDKPTHFDWDDIIRQSRNGGLAKELAFNEN